MPGALASTPTRAGGRRTTGWRPCARASSPERGPRGADLLSRPMPDAPVSVVTGANSGIGRATAIHLAQQGHRVFGTVRATSRMDTFHKLAKADRVDVLVNNAGVGGNAVAEEATPELYLDVMNVNLCGAIRCLKHVLP